MGSTDSNGMVGVKTVSSSKEIKIPEKRIGDANACPQNRRQPQDHRISADSNIRVQYFITTELNNIRKGNHKNDVKPNRKFNNYHRTNHEAE